MRQPSNEIGAITKIVTHPVWTDENCWQVWAYVPEFGEELIVFSGTIWECADFKAQNN